MKEPDLKDVFAALAMHAIMRDRPIRILDFREVSEVAYDMAEEMIRESLLRSQDGKPD